MFIHTITKGLSYGHSKSHTGLAQTTSEMLVVSPMKGPTTLPTALESKSSFVGFGRLAHLV
jgi:hypothetical protein